MLQEGDHCPDTLIWSITNVTTSKLIQVWNYIQLIRNWINCTQHTHKKILSLCSWHHAMETWGNRKKYSSKHFSLQHLMEMSGQASLPSHFSPGQEAPSIHRTGTWVCPEPIWNLQGREVSLGPYSNQTPFLGHPAHSM